MKRICIICLRCQQEFQAKLSEVKRGGGKYCSRQCYLSTSKNKECLTCQKIFKVRLYDEKRGYGLFCSKSCAAKSRIGNKSPNWRGGTINLHCSFCDIQFVSQPANKRKFCSRQCHGKWNSENLKREKSPFWKGGYDFENELIRHSTQYKNWRKAVFERDNYTCILCKTRGGTLNADHIKPFAIFIELRFDINNGRTLCVDCHRKTETYGGRMGIYAVS